MGMADFPSQSPATQNFMVGGRHRQHRPRDGDNGDHLSLSILGGKTAKEVTDCPPQNPQVLGGLLFFKKT
jgi:hypothetical protein